MYEVFELDPSDEGIIDEIMSDELISRQTISVREGESLGIKEGVKYVMIEGSEGAIEKAKEIFDEEGLPTAENSEEVWKAIKKEDKNAATGMGTVFD